MICSEDTFSYSTVNIKDIFDGPRPDVILRGVCVSVCVWGGGGGRGGEKVNQGNVVKNIRRTKEPLPLSKRIQQTTHCEYFFFLFPPSPHPIRAPKTGFDSSCNVSPKETICMKYQS